MSEYILDVSKWRCGDNGSHKFGNGDTHMLNKEGCMCCLGQFAKQMDVIDTNLLEIGMPSEVAAHLVKYEYDGLYDEAFVSINDAGTFNETPLANELIDINDEVDTTFMEKIDLIRNRLEKYGHTLKVVNIPT